MRLKTAMRRGAITICWATVALIESGGAAWAQTQPAPIPVEAPKLGGFGAPFDPAAAANGPPPPLTPVAVERPSDASAPRPAVGWDEFGRTPDGRPLEKAQFGVGRRLVLFVGPLGGDEDGALAVVERLAGWFQEFPERLSDLRVMIVRTGNPDGFARGTRANARGVDLNRNFPTKGWRKIPHGNNWASGPEPASEPETEALIELIREQRPDLVWVVGSSPAAAFTSSNAGSQVVGAVIARHCGSNLRELSVGQASGGLAAYADELGLPTLATTLQDDAAPDDAWNRFGAAFLAGLTAVSLETSVAAPARLAPPVSFSEGNSPVLGSSPQMRRVGELGGVPAGDASFGSAAGSGGLVPLRRPGAAAPPPMFTGVNSALATREAPDAMVAVPPSGETTIPTDAGLRIDAASPVPAEMAGSSSLPVETSSAGPPASSGAAPPSEPPVIRSVPYDGTADNGVVAPHPAFNFFQPRSRTSSPPGASLGGNAASPSVMAPSASISRDGNANGAEAASRTDASPDEAANASPRPGATPRRTSDWPAGYRPPQQPIPLYEPEAKRASAPRAAPVVYRSNET